MPEHIERGARLIVSFELADVRKAEGLYVPELTVKELLEAIREYTHSACSRTGGYAEDISNPFLSVVDFAVAKAAEKAVLALFAELQTREKDIEAKNQELEGRLERLKGNQPPVRQLPGQDLDDDIPF